VYPIVDCGVTITSTDERRLFITLSIYYCVQHGGRDAVRRTIRPRQLLTILIRRRARILQGRVSNPSERGTGGRAPNGSRVWGGAVSFPEKFCIYYIKLVSFYAFPEIFVDTVTALSSCFEHNFLKGHHNQKGRCLNTLDTRWIRHC